MKEEKTKFTPGPWRAFFEGTKDIFVEPGIYYKEVGNEVERAQAVANAHLISAAPELYKCLQSILAYCTINRHYSAPAERALAKARGEEVEE